MLTMVLQRIDEAGKPREVDFGDAGKVRLMLRNTDSGNDALLYKGVRFPEKVFSKAGEAK